MSSPPGAEKLLLGPGPSNINAAVKAALSRPLLSHLDPEFLSIMSESREMLRELMGTENALTFPVSGTGSSGMEFLLVNFLEPGTRILVGVNGVFGGRIASLARKMQAEVETVEADWGAALNSEDFRKKAEKFRPDIIALVNGETSTGIYQNMTGFSEIAREHDALLMLDTVTSLGGMPVELDKWGVDLAFSGTQKCLSVPPGLAPVSVSPRALEKFNRRKTPVQSFYFDINEIKVYYDGENGKRSYHHTAPVGMITALHSALSQIMKEGIENRIRRHRETSDYAVEQLAPLGFTPLAPEENRLHPLLALNLPFDSVQEAEIRRKLLNERLIEVGSGLGPLAGQIWRLGLMGTNAVKNNVDTLKGALQSML